MDVETNNTFYGSDILSIMCLLTLLKLTVSEYNIVYGRGPHKAMPYRQDCTS